jgi:hypothetical protein
LMAGMGSEFDVRLLRGDFIITLKEF